MHTICVLGTVPYISACITDQKMFLVLDYCSYMCAG